MAVLHFTTHIDGPSETIFELIADLVHYGRRLPSSRTFDAVTQVSAPIGLGTTYVNTGSSGAMHGSITDYQPPTRIAFRQSTRIKLLLFAGTLDMNIRYTLEPAGHATRVERDVSFETHGVLKAVQPMIVATIRRESKRLMQVLKHYVETRPEDENR